MATRDRAGPAPPPALDTAIARHVWESKYCYRVGTDAREGNVEASWRRVARALASVEPDDPEGWAERFYRILEQFQFLPAGRILAGAGVDRRVTLFNCFVMGTVEDSIEGIFGALREGAVTLQQGGGVGYDFSTLRPRGTPAASVGGVASGPVSFMYIWDQVCATMLSTAGARRGAMMGTLRCDHPDIERFVAAKRHPGVLSNFNLSVLVFDSLIEAAHRDDPWPLVFPVDALASRGRDGDIVHRVWSGRDREVPCRVLRTVGARELWHRIRRSAYDCAEPGVLFIDRINRENNLYYRERISATNPCGEIPLPPYGACDLGSLNLPRFVRNPFESSAAIEERRLAEAVAVAVRMLDDVIDASRFPIAEQGRQARGTRRIGLGITGLADALLMLGLHYASEPARRRAGALMRLIRDSAYRASVELARHKGPFPFYEREPYLEGNFIQALPEDIRREIAAVGIRNSHLLAIAPTGTISLLAGNVSSGIEPIFADRVERRLLAHDGAYVSHEVEDYACRLWRAGGRGARSSPPGFVDVEGLTPEDHLAMQAAVAPYVDNAISKTVNAPSSIEPERFESIYQRAFDLGLKGCTAFRARDTGDVILARAPGLAAPHCCSPEREAD